MEGLKEGFSTVKRCRKVPFCREHLKNYLQIEMELIAGLFYLYMGICIQKAVRQKHAGELTEGAVKSVSNTRGCEPDEL